MPFSAESIRLNSRAFALLILQFTHVLGQGEPASPSNRDATVTRISLSSEPTCESRTVNYITHTLPQQCLTSSPLPLSNLESVSVTATSTTASIITSADGSTATIDDTEVDEDGDDDLSTGAFMSFEEWKAMMVAKSDQEALDAKPRKRQDRQPLGEFDALGEEGGISLDFDAYSDKISEITAGTRPSSQEKDKEEKADLATTYDEDLAVYRSKDAGKTCKERFSYSSFDAGATTLKTSPGTKNPTAILGESKDSYMLMECATRNKFFIVELSDVILVDTVVLANYEFFSSMIRQFRVSVSDRYPVKLDKWTVLGTFEARNARDIQAFLVENPRIWARYLRVEILNHYGNEFYCPLSLLRVHGMRMLDSLRAVDPTELESEEEASKALPEDTEEEEEAEEAEEIVVEDVSKEEEEEEEEEEKEETHVAEPAAVNLPIVQPKQSEWMAYWDPSYFQYMFLPNSTSRATESPYSSISPEEASEQNAAVAKPRPPRTPEQTSGITSNISTEAISQPTESPTSDSSGASTTTPSPETPLNSLTLNTTEANSTSASSLPITSSGYMNDSATIPSNNNNTPPTSTQSSLNGRAVSKKNKTVAPTSVVKPPSSKPTASRGTPPSSGSNSSGGPSSIPRNNNTNSSSSSSSNNSSNNNDKMTSSSSSASTSTSTSSTATSASSPPAPSPTVQDSFFKTLTKRLQTLESNTTLSLQYIEQQSQFLRSALARLERRQVSRVDAFLEGLNRTVLVELRDARSQCDAIWQSTVIALESQREQAERELVALGERLGVLADEVVFQKRMAIAQSALLLVCLVLVIFSSRGGGGGVMGGGGFSSSSESYYPSQFLAASPTFLPSTPRSGGEKTTVGGGGNNNNKGSGSGSGSGSPDNRNGGPIMISIDSPSPPTSAPPTGGSFAYGRFPDSWPRPRYRQSPSQTLLEIARRQAMPQGRGRGRGLGWGRGYGRSSNGVVMSPPSDNDREDEDEDDNDENDDATTTATATTTNLNSSGPRRLSPSRRAATAPPPPDYYEQERQRQQGQARQEGREGREQGQQPSTPSGMNIDVGYDSEPAMTPNSRSRGDYFQTTATAAAAANNVDNEVAGSSRIPSSLGDETTPPPPPSSYTEVLARKVAKRQLTPSSSSTSDGETDYLPRSSRPPLSHAGSTRTTLPVLPEDAD